jgi:hypothetical protein
VSQNLQHSDELVMKRFRYLVFFICLVLLGVALGLLLLHKTQIQVVQQKGLTDVSPIDSASDGERPVWLTPLSAIDPARWLTEWPGQAENVEYLLSKAQQLLDRADKRFNEEPRMIANRSVQMAEMLLERGTMEHPLEILDDLLAVPGLEVNFVSYSDLCHHYFTIRQRGLERRAALDILTVKYR